MKENVKRIYIIDLIKFVAAICIVLLHYEDTFPTNVPIIRKHYKDIMYLVEMFFIFSGFFIAKEEQNISKKKFIPFFLQRIGRLMPLFWLLLIPQYICMFIAIGGIPPEMTLDNVVANIVVSPVLLRDLKFFIIGPAWYLSVLFVCESVEWIVLFFTKRVDRDPIPIYFILIIFGLILDLTVPLKSHPNLNTILDVIGRGMVPFFSGCLLKHITNIFHGKNVGIIGLIMVITCILSFFSPYSMWLRKTILVSTILYPGLILFLINAEKIEKVVELKFVRELGAVSYTIFISNAVFISLILIIFTYFPFIATYKNSLFGMIVATVVIVALCFPLHYYVEMPITKKFMKFIKKYCEEKESL